MERRGRGGRRIRGGGEGRRKEREGKRTGGKGSGPNSMK